MKIYLEKSSGRAKCRHSGCKRKPEYISSKGRIIKDTMCAILYMESASGWNSSYYCRDCIELIHFEIKKMLNPNLWAFL